MKVIDIYNEISSCKDRWLYYDIECNSKVELEIEGVWEDKYKANEFIQLYFKKGGKSVFSFEGLDYFGKPDERNMHTVSLYILGIYFFDDLYNSKKSDLSRDEFLYLWYMACLYHDIGYAIENSEDYEYKTLEDFIKQIDLKEKEDIFKKCDNQKLCNKKLCSGYYNYIMETRNHIDHGIVGGILLYKKLIESYYKAKAKVKAKADNSNPNDSFHTEDGLYFSPNLFPYYAIAAEAIIRHNMWYLNENNKADYEKYEIEELCADNKVKASDDIILLLLCLGDIIEPLKKFSYDCNVLNEIDIEINNNVLEIKAAADSTKYVEYLKEIESLEGFVDLSIERRKQSVIIKF